MVVWWRRRRGTPGEMEVGGVAPAVGPTGGRPPTFLRDKEKEERGGSGGETLHYPAVE